MPRHVRSCSVRWTPFGVLMGLAVWAVSTLGAVAQHSGGRMHDAGSTRQHHGDMPFHSSRQETFTAPGTRLVLRNDRGDVTLRSDPAARAVTALVTVRAEALTQQEADRVLAKLKASMAASGPGEILAEGDGPDHLNYCSAEISWVITTPADCELRVNTGMGEIVASETRAAAVLQTGMGDITVEGLAGALEARTGMGAIDVKGSGAMRLSTGMGSISIQPVGSVIEPIRAESGMGDVELVFAEGFKACLNAKTDLGEVEFLGGVRIHDAGRRDDDGLDLSGSFRGDIGGPGGPDVRLSSGTGDIRVRIAAAE
jgi:hypothetical protein